MQAKHESVFYCTDDEKAVPSPSDVLFCSICNTLMVQIGWFESLDENLEEGGLNDD